MSLLTRPKLEIRLDHLVDNYRQLAAIAMPAVSAAVVKNDSYGLGAVPIVQKLGQEGCRHFFVAHAAEGVKVREVVPSADIYVLQGVGEDNISDIKKAVLTPVLSTPEQLCFWESQGINDIKPILQVETGLNRLGFRLSDLHALTENQKKNFSFVMSHLACGDNPSHFMNEAQLTQFKQARRLVADVSASISASDGVFLGKAYHFDMVRLGAALYGLNTAPYRVNQMKPVLFVSAPVLQIVALEAGDFIGYGATYQTTRPMKMAVVSIGYGDGLPRALSSRGQIRFNGQAGDIVGRISMDNIMCDVTQMPDLKAGDFVSILDDVYTADHMGEQAGTIGYEILSNLGKGGRFCRSYKQ